MRQTDIAGCAHGVRCGSRNAVSGPHRVVVFESARGEQHASTRPDRAHPTVAFDSSTDDVAIMDDQLDEAGVQMCGNRGIVGHRGEEAADERTAAGEQIRLRYTESLVIQRPADQSLVPAEAVVWHRPRDDVAHSVVARADRRAVVVGPRQDLEREVLVGLEVFDERRAAAHIGLLQRGGGALSDDAAVIPQCLVHGVVAARPNEHRIAGEPHTTPAGIGERTSELIARLD